MSDMNVNPDPYLGSDEEFLALERQGAFRTVIEEDEVSEISNNPKTEEDEVIKQEEVIDPPAEETTTEVVTPDKATEVTTEEKKTEGEEEKPSTDEPAKTDHEAELNKIFAPFKANGREMQVKNSEEAIRLMQMGANYSEKMRVMKPQLKIIRALQDNNLLDESKVLLMVDAAKGNPDAIKRLIKDAKIDPVTLDLDETSDDYKPTSTLPSDETMNVTAALEDLQSSPHFTTLLTSVRKMDSVSKEHFAKNPALFSWIEGHMQSGIYQLVQNEIGRQEIFGKLTGLSDIEKYEKVGNELHAAGAFNSLGQSENTQAKVDKSADVVAVVTTKPAMDPAADKRKAAAPSKTTPAVSAEEDISRLTDEEYLKKYGRN